MIFYITLIALSIVLIIILFTFYSSMMNYSTISLNSTIRYSVHCISLSDAYSRRLNIQDQWKDSDLHFFNAIDTRNELWKLYTHRMSVRGIQTLEKTIQQKHRKHHEELLPGAVGCFLSQIELLKLLLSSLKEDNHICLILEDDCIQLGGFRPKLYKILNTLPPDMDVYLLDWKLHTGTMEYISQYDCNKLVPGSWFFKMNAYLIGKKGIQKILDAFFEIEIQIDAWLSRLNEERLITIYASTIPICSTNSTVFPTSIQIYQVKD